MILKSFQVRRYKNVRCSGEVAIRNDVTCLVGKNESGKSALLQALYRLNPQPTGHIESFVGLRDYPRRHYGHDRERVSTTCPITATFELDDADVHAVEGAHGPGVLASRRVTVTKSYTNETSFEIDCDEKRLVELALESAGLDPSIAQGVDTREDLLAKLQSMKPRDEDSEPLLRLRQDTDARAEIARTVETLLPRFLYFDEYSVMSGRVSVPRLRDGDREDLTPGEVTTLSLMRLANVDLTEFTREEYEARKASLEAAANQLTNDVFSYWSQNRSLSVEFDVDFDRSGTQDDPGPFIEIRIRNHRHGVTLNFSERSQGFTWFFSFLATLSELRDVKNTVLLLDEPGLGLHASAQHDLLRFMDERLVPVHQVVYSTHSPFMVATTALERVRTVEDRDSEGTRVSRELFDHSNDTRLPLQAALCHELARFLPAGRGTLLVEQPSDQVYLSAMSGHLEGRGRLCLDPRWTIVPVGGLAGVVTFVALLGAKAQGLAIMVDLSTPASETLDSPLGRRMLSEQGVIRLADFTDDETIEDDAATSPDDPEYADEPGPSTEAGAGDDAGAQADIEDLFSEDFYVDLVNRSGAAAIETFEILGSGRIVKRIEEATGIGFDRFRPARLLLDGDAISLDVLDDATVERFEHLFRRINGFLTSDSSSSGSNPPETP
ncbi:MAG: AAA family ATPase [Immundisolibacterales bacterium]|nr:AAA family ATPase [Immundisolibacterales bacterium]